jgi:succinate-acetate transporter protein
MNNKAAITSTIGYMCLALTGWMLSMPNAGWFEPVQGHGTSMMYPLALVLVVMGILAFVNETALDAIIFFGGAGLFWAGHEFRRMSAGAAGEPAHYAAWYYFIWAVFFFYVWLGSFSAGLTRMLFLLGLWLALLALAIHDWTGARLFLALGGYIGLITSILAALTSAMAVPRTSAVMPFRSSTAAK